MIDIPIIGIPTSVGYGYGEKGISCTCVNASELFFGIISCQYR